MYQHPKPEFGTSFYHLNQSLLPDDVVSSLAQPEDAQPCQYDEFGFVIDHHKSASSAGSTPCKRTDDSLNDELKRDGLRLGHEHDYLERKTKWIKYLEHEYEKYAPSTCFELSKFDTDLDRSSALLGELIASGPITSELRPFFWLRLSGALKGKAESKFTFTQLSEISLNLTSLTDAQIGQVLPNNACFVNARTVCARRLKHILRIVKWYEKTSLSSSTECSSSTEVASNTSIQQQNLSLIGAYLLLVCNEEDSFWILMRITSESNIVHCVHIVKQLLDKCCPTVAGLLRKHDIEFDLITSNWFSTLFAGFVRNAHLLFAMWDLYFYEGPIFLVQFTLGLLIIESKRLETCVDDSAEMFNTLSDLPTKAFRCEHDSWWSNSDRLFAKVTQAWKAGKNVVSNLPNNSIPPSLMNYYEQQQQQERRDSHGSINSRNSSSCNSLSQEPHSTASTAAALSEQMKLKNVKQTQLLLNLHEAIVGVASHFQAYDLEAKYRLEPNYDEPKPTNTKTANGTTLKKPTPPRKLSIRQDSNDSTTDPDDMQNRLRAYRRRRAKALIDFECNEQDELGFHKNDVITVLNEKDEHCWIGELNGHIGWFPAKFVEMLDERDLDYSIAGDDRVVPFVNDLIRGKLCSALKAIFSYDLRRASYFSAVHPWTVIEEISAEVTNGGDFKQIYSRLVLTKTFRLDEYARVLTPGELLYKSIAAVNHTHGPNTPLDVKFRSLICMGLNQYVLHEWFQLICTSQPDTIARHYGPNSFLSTPVWKLIKAELRLLVQFSFHLNPNAESVPEPGQDPNANSCQPKSPVTKEGVWDMLVKYHLFSWDI